ncbi:MAG: Gfo/Idh/MocA family oxidoreductase [Clostridia bacterium]|nr:Gfo/Idh/MocA family oxidoreductase [Clostridia bacterium]
MEKVNVAVIGLGLRGYGVLSGLLLGMDNVHVVSVCDVYEDRVERAVNKVFEKTGERPFSSLSYEEAIDRPEVEAVLILSSWETHVPISLFAMEHGKAVGMEVCGAYTIEDCWALVDTQERTKVPFMFLENCCYGRNELMVLNMVRQGIFGEIVHATGGYCHDLREEVGTGKEARHYRLRNYLNRNCENYPTHELGPISHVLGINRGNRMLKLVSMGTKSVGMNAYAKANPEHIDPELQTAHFAQSDVVNTLISCANGQTISLILDTTLPRPYSRCFTIRGTLGEFTEDNRSIYLDSDFTTADHFTWQKHWNNVEDYREKYEHPIWQKYLAEGIRGGHGGMDGLVYDAFIESVRLGNPCPIDVYDAAAWMAITPLSEMSLKGGSVPVDVPDFTRGRWPDRVLTAF